MPETGRNLSDCFLQFKLQLLSSVWAERAEIGIIKLPGNEYSEYVLKIVLHVWERKVNTKHLEAPFFAALGGGESTVGQIGPQSQWK